MRYRLPIHLDEQALGKTTAREHCYVESAQLAVSSRPASPSPPMPSCQSELVTKD